MSLESKIDRLLNQQMSKSVQSAFMKAKAHLVKSPQDQKVESLRLMKVLLKTRLKRYLEEVKGPTLNSDSGVKMDIGRPFAAEFPRRGPGRPIGSYKKLPAINMGAFHRTLSPRELTALRPRHLFILQLYISGVSRVEISQRVGVHVQTVTNIVNSSLGRAYLERRSKAQERDMDMLLEPVVDTFRDSLDKDRPIDLRLKAASSYVRLWTGRGSLVKHEISGPKGRPIEISEVIEVKNKLMRLAGISQEAIVEATYKEMDKSQT